MYAFSNASSKVAGADAFSAGLAVSAGFGASFGFGVEPFGSVGFGLAVSAGFGASFGFGVEPFGSVGFGLAVSAGFTSAGFGTSSDFVTEGGSNCSDNFDNFASSSAIFTSRSFFVLVLRFAAIQISNYFIVYVHFV
jgi:hypothetical protein